MDGVAGVGCKTILRPSVETTHRRIASGTKLLTILSTSVSQQPVLLVHESRCTLSRPTPPASMLTTLTAQLKPSELHG